MATAAVGKRKSHTLFCRNPSQPEDSAVRQGLRIGFQKPSRTSAFQKSAWDDEF